ncbi:hypothetical protein PFISCL1PPCAC_4547, partial [Pristionchus fissidentatus]
NGTSKGEVDGGTPKQSERCTPAGTPKTPSKAKKSTKQVPCESHTEFENKIDHIGTPCATGGTSTGETYENMEPINVARASPSDEANKNRAVPILNPY